MNKLLKIVCVALILVSMLSLISCKKKNNNIDEPVIKTEAWDKNLLESDDNGEVYEYYFGSIEDLLYDIKRAPDKYNNAKVKIIGTIYKGTDGTMLVDYTATSANVPSIDADLTSGEQFLQFYDFRNALRSSDNQIDIMISNDAQYAVAEIGDLVKIYGIVKITRDHIFIDNCEYVLIATLDERIQNISETTQ